MDTKIPIVIVGLNFGRHIIDAQLRQGPGGPFFELVGICDINRERAAEASAALGVRAYTDLDELLADPAVPAIGLYTGPAGRADLLRKIIRAGKDVMTTKPFEVNPEAALSVLREARELGRVIHLNSPAPVAPPDLAQIIAWRETYQLGAPVGCRADVWVNYREQADGSWLDDPERCPVAPIFRLGIYLINDLAGLFGDPEEVQVLASRLITGRPTVDNAQLGIRFKRGGLANIFASFCVNDGDYYRNGLVLNFENGTVYRNVGPQRANGADNPLSELSLVTRKDGVRHLTAQAQAEASGNYRWDLFHRAIKGGRLEGETTPEQIVGGLRIIQAMSEAHRTGQCVRMS